MKKYLLIPLLAISLVLNACLPQLIVSSTGSQPEPITEYTSPQTGYQPVQIDSAQVEVGVGSPIPVHLNLDGSLPDSCGQIEYIQLQQDGSDFTYNLSTVSSSDPICRQDTIPLKIKLPLNPIYLPPGSFTIDANGKIADFQLDTANTSASLPDAGSPVLKDDIMVESIQVVTGSGSPIPVHAVLAFSLPNSCAQLGEVRLHRDGTTFYIRLIADILAGNDC